MEVRASAEDYLEATDHVLIRGPTMEQIDQRRLFNFAWCRWSYWNDNGSSATSGKRVDNATGKDDKQHIKRWMQQCIHRLFFIGVSLQPSAPKP